jgi:hypothetical protein
MQVRRPSSLHCSHSPPSRGGDGPSKAMDLINLYPIIDLGPSGDWPWI